MVGFLSVGAAHIPADAPSLYTRAPCRYCSARGSQPTTLFHSHPRLTAFASAYFGEASGPNLGRREC